MFFLAWLVTWEWKVKQMMTCYERWLNWKTFWNYWAVTCRAWPSRVYKGRSIWGTYVFCCEHRMRSLISYLDFEYKVREDVLVTGSLITHQRSRLKERAAMWRQAWVYPRPQEWFEQMYSEDVLVIGSLITHQRIRWSRQRKSAIVKECMGLPSTPGMVWIL